MPSRRQVDDARDSVDCYGRHIGPQADLTIVGKERPCYLAKPDDLEPSSEDCGSC